MVKLDLKKNNYIKYQKMLYDFKTITTDFKELFDKLTQ
jgi:hypothetical protein